LLTIPLDLPLLSSGLFLLLTDRFRIGKDRIDFGPVLGQPQLMMGVCYGLRNLPPFHLSYKPLDSLPKCQASPSETTTFGRPPKSFPRQPFMQADSVFSPLSR